MSIPILAFFNNKGGVGKTTLTYHLAWMFGEMGKRILAADLDPQANLTSAFLDEKQLIEIWEENPGEANTIFRCIKPLLDVGGIREADRRDISPQISLIPGDLELSAFEDTLSDAWPRSLSSDPTRSFRILAAFWHVMQNAAQAHNADLILADVGPNLGAINRSALIASDFVVIPLGADLFSIQGLRNLGPTLRVWRTDWKQRTDNWHSPSFPLPQGNMAPIGYIAQQHGVLLTRPVKAYDRWLNRIPMEYRQSILAEDASNLPPIAEDPYCLGLLKHFHSLVPMAMEARKPLFSLKAADGAIGAHLYSVQRAYEDYKKLAQNILNHIGS